MHTVTELADILWAARPAAGAYVVALTGGVASGKTTLAASLVEALGARSARPRVERVGTDGFIFPNTILIEKGILDRKGFPESFDRDALHAALHRVRQASTVFPGYSHLTYDIDPALSRTIDPPDVLIVEGLGLDGAAPVDALIYLDAEETDQEAWFIARFMGFWEVGQSDPDSFYARFRDLDAAGAAQLAARVWATINRPNLREHIAPLREAADIIVTKASDHSITSIIRERPDGEEFG